MMTEYLEKNEGVVLDEDLPPPPPTSEPPLEGDTPPRRTPRKGLSPTTPEINQENFKPLFNKTNRFPSEEKNFSEIKQAPLAENEDFPSKENGGLASEENGKRRENGERGKENGNYMADKSISPEKKTALGNASVHEETLVRGGVARIVDEIEKRNSLGERSRNAAGSSPTWNDGGSGPALEGESGLSKFEASVLRELPVDVGEMNENNERKQKKEKKENKASVKRTPTMELVKQCSKIGRIRTKILQNLGKADKTTDEHFAEYESNFCRQQATANRLGRDVAAYLRCVRALQGATRALHETLQEAYEEEWAGRGALHAAVQSSDVLWSDFVQRVQDQALGPLLAYQGLFPGLKKKIDKRGRKLVDYDSWRHQLEALERAGRRDPYKVGRVRDQLELARTTYDRLNKELYQELPDLYDQRVARTAETVQALYAAEGTFLRESAKIAQELEGAADSLVQESGTGRYRTTRGTPVTPRPLSDPSGTGTPATKPQAPREEVGRPYEEIQFEETKTNGGVGTRVPAEKKTDGLYDVPLGASTGDLPPGVLYRVRTTYKYDREDVDELSFDVGEVICVVEYDDPEDQEEGWLCGYKADASPSEKGLFPANFTRPI